MRLGYLVPEFPSQTHTFFWREVTALREQGLDVRLLSTRRPPLDACRHSFAGPAREETTYLFPAPWLRALSSLLLGPVGGLRALAYILGLEESSWRERLPLLGLMLVASELKRICRKQGIDHVHVHSCATAAHLVAMTQAMGGPSYSLTLHGDLDVYGRDHRFKMRGARFVAAVTRPLQKQLRQHAGVPDAASPLLWMGVDTRSFSPPLPDARQPTDALHLLTVARLNPAKGIRFALQAVRAALDQGIDVHYSVAGEGPDRGQLEADIARLGLQARVSLLGTQGEHEVLGLLRATDALLLTSIGEGEAAPVSVMEAMACGLPVVASVIGGTPEMIVDGQEGFLVPQGDVAAITACIVQLSRDVALRHRLSQAARKRAENSFDARSQATRFIALLNALPVRT